MAEAVPASRRRATGGSTTGRGAVDLETAYPHQIDERGLRFHDRPIGRYFPQQGEPPDKKGGFWTQGATWDWRTGTWKHPLDWGRIGLMGSLGLVGGGLLAGALAGVGGASSVLPSYVPATGMAGMEAAPTVGGGLLASSVPVSGATAMTAAPAAISSQSGLGPSYSMLSKVNKYYRPIKKALSVFKESDASKASKEDNRLSNLKNLMNLAEPNEGRNQSNLGGGLLTQTFKESPDEYGSFSGYR